MTLKILYLASFIPVFLLCYVRTNLPQSIE